MSISSSSAQSASPLHSSVSRTNLSQNLGFNHCYNSSKNWKGALHCLRKSWSWVYHFNVICGPDIWNIRTKRNNLSNWWGHLDCTIKTAYSTIHPGQILFLGAFYIELSNSFPPPPPNPQFWVFPKFYLACGRQVFDFVYLTQTQNGKRKRDFLFQDLILKY